MKRGTFEDIKRYKMRRKKRFQSLFWEPDRQSKMIRNMAILAADQKLEYFIKYAPAPEQIFQTGKISLDNWDDARL